MPRANLAFMSDGFGSMLGGLLGTSALTTCGCCVAACYPLAAQRRQTHGSCCSPD